MIAHDIYRFWNILPGVKKLKYQEQSLAHVVTANINKVHTKYLRSSHRRCSVKNDLLNFSKFHKKFGIRDLANWEPLALKPY